MIRFVPHSHWLALGMASVVLGYISLLLFLMPILGIPISVLGLGLGILGFLVALFAQGPALRWSLAGIFMCGLALSVNVAIVYAPSGYLPSRAVPKPWQPPPGRAEVPPPVD